MSLFANLGSIVKAIDSLEANLDTVIQKTEQTLDNSAKAVDQLSEKAVRIVDAADKVAHPQAVKDTE